MHGQSAKEESMSEMSQEQGRPGGDPLDVVGAVGTEDDVLPGPPGGVVGEESGEDVSPAQSGPANDADQAPEAGPVPDPPGRQMDIDPAAGNDPLDDADTEGMRPPGVGDSTSGSDPMPDMTGTTD
jgi:hypothetical protein